MKIWVVGRGYPTPANRMWGSFEFEQAKLLARYGHDVTYIALTLSFFNRKDPRGMRSFREDGVLIIASSHLYFPGKFGFYWERFEDKCWRSVFQEAEKYGLAEIIHIHYPSMVSSINVIEEYRKRGVRIFVTEHWSRVLTNNLKSHELSRLKYYTENANCFASVSLALNKAVKKIVNVTVPTAIIPNFAAPVFFQTTKQNESDKFTFAAIGRLVPLKQFDVIISQFISVFRENNEVELRIIGSGPERRRLEALCAGDNRISFYGEVDLQFVADLLANSEALVSFSKYETFAAPVAEAWAEGKPIIVSDKSGIASYVNSDLGIVVQSDAPEELGDAMIQLYKHYSRFDSGLISEFAKDHFSDQAEFILLQNMYSTSLGKD